jgi:hypothetical protein
MGGGEMIEFVIGHPLLTIIIGCGGLVVIGCVALWAVLDDLNSL